MAVENFPFTQLIKLRLLTHGNFRKTENTVSVTRFCSYLLKVTAVLEILFKKQLELTVNKLA